MILVRSGQVESSLAMDFRETGSAVVFKTPVIDTPNPTETFLVSESKPIGDSKAPSETITIVNS